MKDYLVNRDGEINHGVAGKLFGGTLTRDSDVCHRDRLTLVPVFDQSRTVFVYDSDRGTTVATLQLNAIPSAEALVDRLDAVRDELPPKGEGDGPDNEPPAPGVQ